ncbi:LemA family protein [Opitutus sp. ER46]|uniref:LemA family protein n=1 Tax=Opitutus sp. ER46 TaxID=2161864 RepID=UPI000D2F692B|nr:LemA family protein [Opitutus sp. ER46]PTX90810.1 LemA domain-containing protein [Opitutus sp. ER46]
MSDLTPILVSALVALIALWLSLRLRRQQRLLADLPTSKTQGVFIGLVELAGTAESEAPLRSFLSEEPCVHYAYDVSEHWSRTVVETYTDSKGRSQTRTRTESGWRSVASGGETRDFYLRDDTGAVLIRPEKATLEPATVFEETVGLGHPLYYGKGPEGAVPNSQHRRRFVETAIPLHRPLYIVGQARERQDVVAPEIAAAKDAAMYLISVRAEKSVQRGKAGWSWFWWVIGLLAAGVAGFLLQNGGVLPLPVPIAIYLAAWGLTWTWMVFNSLVELRQRVRQGWSLIDVQLKRRNDLIPGVVAVVSALQSHEATTQTAVAALRAQLAATRPGVAGPDFEGVAGTIRAVVERYPELVAQEGFAQLHRTLVETEQRIALARTYYNDIATQFATRLERLPDRWVAALARMQPEPLLAAASFERASVKMRLVE